MTTFRILTAGWTLAAPLALALISGCNESQTTQPPDTANPQIVSTSPAPGATEVYTTTTIEVAFNKPVEPGTVVVLVNAVARGAQ